MKKGILKIFGVVALAAGMLYNVQVFNAENGLDISMAALGVMAVANNEGGGCSGYRTWYTSGGVTPGNRLQEFYDCTCTFRSGYDPEGNCS